MKKILCIGQAAYDITLVVDKYPTENKKMRAKDQVECAGGSAFNSAYLLAKWNIDTTYVGCVGEDYYGEKIRKEANDIGLKTYFETSTFTTTSYIIANITTGSRTIITNKNKEAKVKFFEPTEEYDMLVLDSNEVELSLKMLAKYPKAISILDAGKYCEEVLKLGKYVTYFVCSKDFAEGFTGLTLKTEEDYKNAYDKIKEEFQTNVIITLESKGSFTKQNDTYKLVPSILVHPIDSTGAGDIYHATLAYYILNETPLLDAMRYANIAGALSTTKIGSKASIPEKEEVEKEAEDEIL